MCCNNNFGGNGCLWIIILLVLFYSCGNGFSFGGCNTGCNTGCGSNCC